MGGATTHRCLFVDVMISHDVTKFAASLTHKRNKSYEAGALTHLDSNPPTFHAGTKSIFSVTATYRVLAHVTDITAVIQLPESALMHVGYLSAVAHS